MSTIAQNITLPALTTLPDSHLKLKEFAIVFNQITSSAKFNEYKQTLQHIQQDYSTLEDIKAAESTLELLNSFTLNPTLLQSSLEQKAPTRCYVDGAFDLIHSGHYNAIRQASHLCDQLVVGVNASKHIQEVKGPVVLTDDERCALMNACKFVTHVEGLTPYDVSEQVLDQFNCEFYAHGDDPCYNLQGEEICEKLSKLGRFKQFQRTPGVSTTNITNQLVALVENIETETAPKHQGPPKQKFLQTAQRIRSFCNDKKPQPGQKIVYYQASCDLMHPGVIERVRKAKEEGDFLYVGIWDDETVRYYRGDKYPLVNMQERLLMALSCRYIDDVVIGAPFVMTEDLIKSLNIDKVVNVISRDDETLECYHEVDPFEAAKTMQVYTEIEQDDQELTVLKIAQRVADNKQSFQEKVARKTQSEELYVQRKTSGMSGAM